MPHTGLYIGSSSSLAIVLVLPIWALNLLYVKIVSLLVRPSLNFWQTGPFFWSSFIETSSSAVRGSHGGRSPVNSAEYRLAEEVVADIMNRVQAAASEVLMHAYANRRSGQIHIDMSERNSGDSSRAPEIPDEDGEEASHGTNDTERARAQFARLRQTISQNEGAQTEPEQEVSYQSIDIPSIRLPSPDEATEVLDSLGLTTGADPAAPRALLEEICTYFATLVPFVILFALKAVIDNYGDLIRLITGIFCFMICDGYIQAVVAAGRPSFQQRATMTVGLVIGLIATSNIIAPVDDYNICKVLSFQYAGNNYHGFTYTLLIIILTDNFVKLVTVLMKLIIVMLPFISPHQKRRNFQSTEYMSQFYRCIVPAIQWVYYFLGDSPDSYAIIDVGLASTYIGLKCREIYVIGTVMYQSIRRLFEVSNYGVKPTSAEIEEAGMCSICHDRLASPTKLSCSHMFCHSCIDTWLDKEHTCPMCRAVIDKQDNDFKTGATSKLVRFY